MAATSPIAAVMTVYDGLTAANFPNATRPPIYMGEAPTYSGGQLRPPYVVIRDLGGEPKWTFTSAAAGAAGQNAIVAGSFVLEAYANTLADCDTTMQAVLWNGQHPNSRAGLAFATLTLTLPQKAIAAAVVPTKDQHDYAGLDYQGQRVHVLKQWFSLKTAISGDGT